MRQSLAPPRLFRRIGNHAHNSFVSPTLPIQLYEGRRPAVMGAQPQFSREILSWFVPFWICARGRHRTPTSPASEMLFWWWNVGRVRVLGIIVPEVWGGAL